MSLQFYFSDRDLFATNCSFRVRTPACSRGVTIPSTLKITDLGVATIVKPGPSPCPIIRINTKQGVYGLGEVRDGRSPTYALFLRSRVGENPLQLDNIFR